jgi:hypothetical protein
VINGGADNDIAQVNAVGWTSAVTMAGNLATSMTLKSGARPHADLKTIRANRAKPGRHRFNAWGGT